MAQPDLNSFYKATGPLAARQQVQQTEMGDLRVAGAEQNLETGKLDQAKKKNDLTMKIISTVSDQGTYTRALDIARKYGLDVDTLPAEYDPQVIDQIGRATMSYKDKLDEQYRQDNLDLNRDKLDLSRDKLAQGGERPSSAREWDAYNKLSPEDQSRYLTMKRASKTVNLGGTQSVLNPTGGIAETYDVTPTPEQMPEFKAEQAQAVAVGREKGDAQATLETMQSQMPRIEQVVAELGELSKIATYTKAGQLRDTAARQAGLPVGEGAIARTEYISKIDNEVLPLLRQTFGAAFTEREGQSLKNTLGDPDKSPEEKDAVLRSFISQKLAQVESLQRQVYGSDQQQAAPAQEGVVNWEDLP